MELTKEIVMEAYKDLKHELNFSFCLKKEQFEGLCNLYQQKDCLIVLPTGFGKSLIFLLYPLILDKVNGKHNVCVVVSPLTALMQSMANNYRMQGFQIKTTAEITDDSDISQVSIILSSPEHLFGNDKLREMIVNNKEFADTVCLLAIDEAHLITEWGDEFRQTYKKLAQLRTFYDQAPVALFSATVDPKSIETLKTVVAWNTDRNCTIARLPNRPNITIEYNSRNVVSVLENLRWLVDSLRRDGPSASKTIIYCRGINIAGEIYTKLVYELKDSEHHQRKGMKLVRTYHSEMSTTEKEEIVSDFSKTDSTVRLLICTVAFGMGVDIPNIRTVVHWGESDSVLTYWQEIGRAGRDGKSCKAITYHIGWQLRNCKENMKTLIKKFNSSNSCFRNLILEELRLEEMEPLPKEPKVCQSGNCDLCICSACVCCGVCRSRCPCSKE